MQGSDSCQVIKLLGEMQPCALTPPFDGRMVVVLLSALFLALCVVLAAVELSSLNIHSTSAVDFVTHVDLLSPFISYILARLLGSFLYSSFCFFVWSLQVFAGPTRVPTLITVV